MTQPDMLPAHNFDEATLQARLALFRYTDLSHPLLQTLFALQPPAAAKPVEHD